MIGKHYKLLMHYKLNIICHDRKTFFSINLLIHYKLRDDQMTMYLYSKYLTLVYSFVVIYVD